MQSSGDDWCVHYDGFYDHMTPRVTCNAGVDFNAVKTEIEFTYSRRNDPRKYTSKTAHPCFKHQAHLTNGCAKCRFPTVEELKQREVEANAEIERYKIARSAIIEELKRRYDSGDKTVKLNGNPDSDVECFDDSPKNYHSGYGTMKCPNCKDGVLKYSRAGYNGHVHAKCSTEDCAAWME